MSQNRVDLAIIEDDHSLRRLLVRVFGTMPFITVSAFETAEEAGPVLFEFPPRVLLTCLTLPGRGGDELAADLKERSPETIFFAMTGNPDCVEAVKGRFHRIFTKPFIPSQILAHVELALLGRLVKS